ncbi:hypothetical protein G3580_10085 [Nitrogeniibacter mangrovi]|uniref:Uncharacterized protein n=1 Tax=Nitrogeniibacter mangrovi TaxID=2016596 RepID=A0A6C1B5A5_9RHOO|nr:hypothetical protein [Nitrogeniibacter mangrovi]QID17958.1 hypothetical protein G3580_10085 [Nitrogeniibacter mangrovi]
MTWYVLNLGDAMLAGDAVDRIQSLFEQWPSRPAGAAVFMRHESEGRLHCELRVYLPPAAAPLAQQLGATPCAPPDPGDLGVLAGEPAALKPLRRD